MYLWRLMRNRNFNVFTSINNMFLSFHNKIITPKINLTSF